MAHNNKEIEIKISVDRKTFVSAEKRLKKIARFEKLSEQKDEYFTPAHRNFVGRKYPHEWFSLRRRSNKAIVNYKRFYPEGSEIFTHCDEFEAEISNPGHFGRILDSLNMKKLVVVSKKRKTYLYKEDFEIALDYVNDLGYFIEIEALKDFGGVEKTRKKLFEFARQLGIKKIEADKRGYPYLLMEKKGLIRRR